MCKRCEEHHEDEPRRVDSNVTKYGFTAGDFVLLKDGIHNKYTITKAGVLCLILGIRQSHDMMGEVKTFAQMIAFDDGHGDAEVNAEPLDFRKATPEEVEKRRADCLKLWQLVEAEGGLETGDPVRLSKDVVVRDTGPMGCGTTTIRKGTYAILDFGDGAEDTEEEAPHNRSKAHGRGPRRRKQTWQFHGATIHAQDFYGPRSSVYIPDQEAEYKMPLSSLERNPTECLQQKLVLPEGHMSRLMSVMKRVISADVASAMYEKLKLHRVCSKGRGAIALLYGPPGVGKTMTAEVVAEMMGRSLIKLSLCASNSEELVRRLSVGFQRAKRYRSVLLLDEVDVFIRKRGGQGGVAFDENTSVFLRMMEYYDGVLLMTTNLPDQIDPAVFSRVHVCLEYTEPKAADRKAIWNGMLPTELKAAITGTEADLESMLTELSEIPINGREIKTVIQNAVGKALSVLNEGRVIVELPAVKWVPRSYFLQEAQLLYSQRETLS
jgi:hypothetical protein